MSITWAVTLVTAASLAAAPAGCAPVGVGSSHPEGEHGCQNSWRPPVAVRFAIAAPKVRATLHVTCDRKVIAHFMARISIEHKDGFFADWYEVAHDSYFDPPGLGHSYVLLAPVCRDGLYRAKASIGGQFVNGEAFKVTEETSSARVDCERPEPVT
ncbi:hypothetical protein [Nonomuraea candida]|uniref:hypothetical protein n=1 Tax=Nonomuraea candida TaxID=359159 RepID=UPI0005B8EB63|nr:hypothetical protein [Nonomuraea candida]